MAGFVHQEGIQSHWEEVWNDIRDKSQSPYFYFYGYDTNTSEKLYTDNAQQYMADEATNVVSKINKISVRKDGLAILKKNFEKKKNEIEKTEIALLKEMKYSTREYRTLGKEKIQLWTSIFKLREAIDSMAGGSLNITEESCFRTLISSNDFILLYRDKSGKYSELSMTKFLKGQGKNVKNSITDEQRLQAGKDFYTSLGKNGKVRKAIVQTIQSQIEKDFGNEISQTAIKDVETVLSNVSGNFKQSFDTNVGFSLSVMDQLKNDLKKGLEDVIRNNYNGTEVSYPIIDIGFPNNSSTFLTISIEEPIKGAYSEISQKMKKNTGQDKLTPEQKRYNFILAVLETWKQMKASATNNLELNLDYAGKVSINGDLLTEFKKKVDSYINNKLRVVTSQIFFDNSTFLSQDWNSSVMTGMLGELSAFLTNFPDGIKKLTLTGNKVDIKTLSNNRNLKLGEGFRDLTFIYNNVQYGINVKRYVNSSKNFKLYGDKDNEGVGIGSQYIYRYFSEEEVQLMRFIEGNYQFLTKKIAQGPSSIELPNEFSSLSKIDTLYKDLSISRLDRFVRLTSGAVDSTNLFYLINNIAIPASYIYEVIIETLNQLDVLNKMFQIKRGNLPKYEEIEAADVQANENKLPKRLDNPGNVLDNSAKIVFKGLTLNNLKDLFK